MLTPMVQEFLRKAWQFLKEIFMFGVDAFMIAAAREIGKRFWERLREKGGAIGQIEEPVQKQIPIHATSGGQRSLPFLDEYRD